MCNPPAGILSRNSIEAPLKPIDFEKMIDIDFTTLLPGTRLGDVDYNLQASSNRCVRCVRNRVCSLLTLRIDRKQTGMVFP